MPINHAAYAAVLPDYDPGLAESIPPATLAGLVLYATQRCPVGHFLTAVLSNDLMEAVGSADNDNAPRIAAICQFVHWCLLPRES
jgi:hypothetical protein